MRREPKGSGYVPGHGVDILNNFSNNLEWIDNTGRPSLILTSLNDYYQVLFQFFSGHAYGHQ